MLRVFSPSGTATVIVFYSGSNIFDTANTQHSLVIDLDTIIVPQIVIKSSITLIRAFCMDLFNPVGQTLVLSSSAAQFSRSPFMISGTSHMEQDASCFNGVSLFLMTFFDCHVNLALSYF